MNTNAYCIKLGKLIDQAKIKILHIPADNYRIFFATT